MPCSTVPVKETKRERRERLHGATVARPTYTSIKFVLNWFGGGETGELLYHFLNNKFLALNLEQQVFEMNVLYLCLFKTGQNPEK